MSTGHVLLGLLSRGQQHGYDLKRAHDAAFPTAKPIAYGQVYAALDRLRRQGLIEAAAVEQADGPERTVFALTPKGREALGEWMGSIDEPSEFVANPLATKLTITLLADGRGAAIDFLRGQRGAHAQRMRHFTAATLAPGSTTQERLAADYALSHLDADIRWIDAARERLDALEEEITHE
ncbi:PadR family transcriptional regulator [Actinomycetota bacterium]